MFGVIPFMKLQTTLKQHIKNSQTVKNDEKNEMKS